MSESAIEKIIIIEGPPPAFELSPETWLPAVAEGPALSHTVMCRLRTFNGPALVERCHRAWQDHKPVHLEYRTPDGLTQEALILGARNVEVEEGHLLLLWVRLTGLELQMELDLSDDDVDDDFDDLDISPDAPF